ncbi:MAG: hypothetical protein J0H17_05860 [Rhizobiales bacterium]|nr:hypothetical protein [Hyphomicrobiales bacterium]
MRDLALQAAGMLAILAALIHGALAELSVFPNAQVAPRGARRLLRLVWQASTVDWIAIGVLLIAAPALGSDAARHAIIALAVVVYGYATVGNAVATRGRHYGWCLMLAIVVLALLGL